MEKDNMDTKSPYPRQRFSLRQLTVIGLLSALTVVLGVSGLGFIPIPPIYATILHIPTLIGALLEGPKSRYGYRFHFRVLQFGSKHGTAKHYVFRIFKPDNFHITTYVNRTYCVLCVSLFADSKTGVACYACLIRRHNRAYRNGNGLDLPYLCRTLCSS